MSRGNTGCLLVADEGPTPVVTRRLDQFYIVFVPEAVLVVCAGHSCRTSTAPTKTHRHRFKPMIYREQPAQAVHSALQNECVGRMYLEYVL